MTLSPQTGVYLIRFLDSRNSAEKLEAWEFALLKLYFFAAKVDAKICNFTGSRHVNIDKKQWGNSSVSECTSDI